MKKQIKLPLIILILFIPFIQIGCKKDNATVKQTNTPITLTYTVNTFAGSGAIGSANGQGILASFNQPRGVALDASGNMYVADAGNYLIRKITPAGLVSTLAGSGIQGSLDGQGTAASFTYPDDIAVDAAGNIYVTDYLLVRKITPSGLVSTFAGSGTVGSIDGQGTAASFNGTSGIAIDASGNIFLTDVGNHNIRKITPSGLVSTFAGNGKQGSTDGQGTAASFYSPAGIVLDASGNIYISDFDNNNIRKITPTALVSTFAGNSSKGSANGQGATASFSGPDDIALDAEGNIYVPEYGNNDIRKITPAGLVSTIAGSGSQGSADGQATIASFSAPIGIAVDASGNIYVGDEGNNKIRKITHNP